MMDIGELKGNLLQLIRTSEDEELLLDLKSRVDIDFYLKDTGIYSILGGVDNGELVAQANEPNTTGNSMNEHEFKTWLKEWKSS